jgi:hypothetical protein
LGARRRIRNYLTSVAGLIGGGVVAAPLAGWMVKALQEMMRLRFVEFLITLLAVEVVSRV